MQQFLLIALMMICFKVEAFAGDCASSWWCEPTVTKDRLDKALSDLDEWAKVESQNPLYYSSDLVPMPMDENLKAFNRSNFNNIYGYGYLHWILKKSAKFTSLLFPGRSVTVLRVNTNHPYSNPSGSPDAHGNGLDVDMGYILFDPENAASMIDFEAQFWFTYMLYAEARVVTAHRYSGFNHVHEMESLLDMSISRELLPRHWRFSGMTDPWEFSHVSHFHFGVNPCARITKTNVGPRCQQ